ncbi:MAG: hypothetical protein ACE5LL_05470 [Alphaproteobacteria bacterium]
MCRWESKVHAFCALLLLLTPIVAPGCAAVALGVAGGAGGYEAYQASEMEQLEQDYKSGKISKEEYDIRKKQIDETSLFQ